MSTIHCRDIIEALFEDNDRHFRMDEKLSSELDPGTFRILQALAKKSLSNSRKTVTSDPVPKGRLFSE